MLRHALRPASRPHRRLAALLGCTLGLVVAAPARAACELKQFEIPVHLVGQRPVAKLTLNGVEVPLLVDSGAFFSMLSASTAAQLKLPLSDLPMAMQVQGYTGTIHTQKTEVKRVGLIGAVLPDVDFLVGGNDLGAGIMGVLGRNILAAADTEYDLAHGVVRMSLPKGDCAKTNFAHWAGNAPVVVEPLRVADRKDDAVRVDIRINGKTTRALMDTGAPRTSLTLDFATEAGIRERDLKEDGRAGGAGKGRVKSWRANVAAFELGGEKITNAELSVDDVGVREEGALLGLDYFLSHRIYVSRLQRKVYITWNGSTVFPAGAAGAAELDARYAAPPQQAPLGDADALARRGSAALAAGDHTRALADLDRACELAPGVADYFLTRARIHLAMGSMRRVQADLDEALRLEPMLAQARILRSRLWTTLGDHANAQADLAHLDETLPPVSPLRAEMASLYTRLALPMPALRQFQLWIEHHPHDAGLAGVLNERCWLRARLGLELRLALEDCRRAVAEDRDVAAYHDSLGWAYLRIGDAAQARRAFDAAVAREPLAFSLYGRGLAHLMLEERASAENDFAAARKKKPSVDDDLRAAGFGELVTTATAAAPPR